MTDAQFSMVFRVLKYFFYKKKTAWGWKLINIIKPKIKFSIKEIFLKPNINARG